MVTTWEVIPVQEMEIFINFQAVLKSINIKTLILIF